MIGLRSLFTLPVLIGPLVLIQVAEHVPVIDKGTLIPLGLVMLLIAAVWKAAREVEKLTAKLGALDKLVRRVVRIETQLGIRDDE